MNEQPQGFDFPCQYPVKVMGPNDEQFLQQVTATIKQHAPEVSANSVNYKVSSNAKYRSVTVLVMAQSKQHLINIYQAVKTIEGVVWTL